MDDILRMYTGKEEYNCRNQKYALRELLINNNNKLNIFFKNILSSTTTAAVYHRKFGFALT